MTFAELVKDTERVHCNDPLIVGLMRTAWLESKYDSLEVAQIKYVDYPCSGFTENGNKPFWTVQNTSAKVICQTFLDAEAWAIDNNMRVER